MMPAGLHVNKTGCVISICVLAVVLYFGYTSHYTSPALLTQTESRHRVQIPKDVFEVAASVEVQSKSAQITVTSPDANTKSEINVFYLEALPIGVHEKAPIVLLHGQGDSSKQWSDINTINICAALGHRTIAVDLPKHGKTDDIVINTSDRGSFLQMLLSALSVTRPVLIPVSMGGSYALPYLMQPDPLTCESRVSGFVPIAIVGTSNYKDAQYHRCEVPTMIVYGTNDTGVGVHSVGDLRNLKNSQIAAMEKAGHACHFERPDEWHYLLYNFLLHLPPYKPAYV